MNPRNKTNETELQEVETKVLLKSKTEDSYNSNVRPILILISILFTNTFIHGCLYFPQGLQSMLLVSPYNFSNTEYGVLFAMSAVPNLILPFFVGLYIDKKGYGTGLIMLLGGFAIFGMFLTMLGSYWINFYLMVIGRFIMGIGTENYNLLAKKMCLQTFSKKNMFGVWGFYLFSKRFGSSGGCLLPPFVYGLTSSIPWCFFVGVIVTIIMTILMMNNYCLMRNSDLEIPLEIDDDTKSLSWKELFVKFFDHVNHVFWIFIIMSILNATVYIGVMSEFNDVFVVSLNISAEDASYIVIIFEMSLGVFQLSGFILAKVKNLMIVYIVGGLSMLISFIIFLDFLQGSTEALFLIPIFFFSIGFACSSNFFFSSLAYLVSKEFYGVAYGIFQNTLNFGIVIGPILFGLFKDLDNNQYYMSFGATLGIQVIILILAGFLWFFDSKEHNYLKLK